MNFDIVTKGVGAFVQPRYHNQMFALVHPQIMDEEDTLDNYDGVVHVQGHCGFEDTVVNHLTLLKRVQNKEIQQGEVEMLLQKRAFTVRCIQHMECLGLNFKSFEIIRKDFSTQMRDFIKVNISQTWMILSQLLYMMQNFDSPVDSVDQLY